MSRPMDWKDAPSLIEKLFPAQKISAEAQKERKAVHGQTLTALGSYWKGRKPLILVKALRPGRPPAGDRRLGEGPGGLREPDGDRRSRLPAPGALALTGLDRSPLPRFRGAEGLPDGWPVHGPRHQGGRLEGHDPGRPRGCLRRRPSRADGLRWSRECPASERNRLTLAALATLTYLGKLDVTKRPEQLPDGDPLRAGLGHGERPSRDECR